MEESRRHLLCSARQRVLSRLMSGWRRRGASLLQAGAGDGSLPEFFWEAGFDVTVVDRSPERLAEAREQTGSKVGHVCGSPGHLPFDDGSFDYAVIVHQGLVRGVPEREAVFLEALRVAVRGVIILEWNRFSLCGVPRASERLLSASGGKEAEEAVYPWGLYRLAKEHGAGRRLFGVSALPLWERCWPDPSQGGGLLHRIHVSAMTTPVRLPLGALMGLRVDWAPVTFTPVGMLRSAAASLCVVKQQGEEVLGRSAQRHQHR